jgi:hypothetical protein
MSYIRVNGITIALTAKYMFFTEKIEAAYKFVRAFVASRIYLFCYEDIMNFSTSFGSFEKTWELKTDIHNRGWTISFPKHREVAYVFINGHVCSLIQGSYHFTMFHVGVIESLNKLADKTPVLIIHNHPAGDTNNPSKLDLALADQFPKIQYAIATEGNKLRFYEAENV